MTLPPASKARPCPQRADAKGRDKLEQNEQSAPGSKAVPQEGGVRGKTRRAGAPQVSCNLITQRSCSDGSLGMLRRGNTLYTTLQA